MIIYTGIENSEKELSFDDYKPIRNINPKSLSMDSLTELRDNIENAMENAFLFGNDLLQIALDMDINKVNLYIRMKEKQARQQQEGKKQ